jgi:hypothetical protein
MGDIKDLMRITGQGRQAVTSAIDRGDLPGYRVGAGRKIWVHEDTLEQLRLGTWVPASRRKKLGHHDVEDSPFMRTFNRE